MVVVTPPDTVKTPSPPAPVLVMKTTLPDALIEGAPKELNWPLVLAMSVKVIAAALHGAGRRASRVSRRRWRFVVFIVVVVLFQSKLASRLARRT